MELDQLKKIKTTNSRLKRNIKMLLDKGQKIPLCTSKTKEC